MAPQALVCVRPPVFLSRAGHQWWTVLLNETFLELQSRQSLGLAQVESDIADHVLLASDHASPAKFNQDLHGWNFITLTCSFSVPQKAGIHAGVPKCERLAIDTDWSLLQRSNEVVRCVHERDQVASMSPALPICCSDEDLKWRVTGTCSHSRKGRINPETAVFNSGNRVCYTQRQVVMCMNSKLSFRTERLSKRIDSFTNLTHQQSPARIDEIDTARPVRFHQSPLLGQATRAI